MFTGIIETCGKVRGILSENENVHFTIETPLASQLKVDQSVSHNGVCLTVTHVNEHEYSVTAIQETLLKSNLGLLKLDDRVNLERSLMWNGRIDGHIVQGHVDGIGQCVKREEAGGSWVFGFEYAPGKGRVTVEKGSICVNGVSLTVINSKLNGFEVAIIPYTYDHTNFNQLELGAIVNLEFDILGKYVEELLLRRENI